MKTITVQIGNSDDRLKQQVWSEFVRDVNDLIAEETSTVHVHFFGTSNGWSPWQNACWCFTVDEVHIQQLKQSLRGLAFKYGQESIAFTEGETEFISQPK